MTKLSGLIRLSRWQLDEKRRALAELETLAQHLRDQSRALQAEMQRERDFADAQGSPTPSLGAYIRTALDRQSHLATSIAEVEQRMTIARDEIAEAYQEVKRYELAEAERARRARERALRRETQTLDEIGAVRFDRARRLRGAV